MEPIKWPNQFAHMLFSTSILLGRALWFPKNSQATFAVVLGLLYWALFKELVWDLQVEKSQGIVGALIDAVFYFVGAIGTAAALYFTGKF